jgi:glycosyltransferase involved in cell wall biosynthesis
MILDVTVVIPTRDRWLDLSSAALPAALAQERVGHEIVVVDDGSLDETPRGLAALHEPHLRVLRNGRPMGVAAARNRGIAAARAEWIAFLDDDDLWSPLKLRLQLDAAAAAGADFVYAGGIIVDGHGRPLRDDPAPEPHALAEELARRNVVGGPSAVLVRTGLLRALEGFDEEFSVLADWELWIRLAGAGRAAACRERLVAYREHSSNMSGRPVGELFSELDRLVERHGATSVDGEEFTRWVAAQQRRAGRRLAAAHAYLRGGLAYRSPRLLARAGIVPFGEGAMQMPRRLRAARGIVEQPPPAPGWIAGYRRAVGANGEGGGAAPVRPPAAEHRPKPSGRPQVTVVIPTRDRWPRVATTLRTALAQEDVEIEVVVVDDGSVDETQRGLAALKEPRLRVVRNVRPRGVAAARNAALAEARAEWAAFLDDDDVWAPHKLRVQLERATATGADFVYGGAVRLREPDLVLRGEPAPSAEELARRLLIANVIPAGSSNVLARLRVVRDLGGFDEALVHLDDWDLWIRLAIAARGADCRHVLVGQVEHRGNRSLFANEALAADFDYLVAKHREASAAHGVCFDAGRFERGAAYEHLRSGRRLLAARGYLRGAAAGDAGNLIRAAAALIGGERAMRRLGRGRRMPPREEIEWVARAWRPPPLESYVGSAAAHRAQAPT